MFERRTVQHHYGGANALVPDRYDCDGCVADSCKNRAEEVRRAHQG